MDLFNVRFTYDGEKLRGASGVTAEAIHSHRINLPVSRWVDVANSDDICDLLDLVVEQLAVFSDTLHVANRQLRRRREQQQLW